MSIALLQSPVPLSPEPLGDSQMTRARLLFALLLSLAAVFVPATLGESSAPSSPMVAHKASQGNLEALDASAAVELVLPTTTVAPTTLPPATTPPTTTRPMPTPTTAIPESEPAESIALEPGSGGGDPNDPASWDRLAQCESGGDWSINTGNGYYGGLQFSLSSWRAVGGTGYPHEHSRSTQIEMGQRLHSQGGWRHWPGCSRSFGWI